jgi:hypothetical protein
MTSTKCHWLQISHLTCHRLSLFFLVRLMELSSDEETWGSLRIDNNSSKKLIPEKRPSEPTPRATKKANREPSHSNIIESVSTESSKASNKRNLSGIVKKSKESNGAPLNPLTANDIVTDSNNVSHDRSDIAGRADKTIASTLPSNGLQGISSKLKNSHDGSSPSAATPVGSPKSVKVKEIKHSERVVQASIARYKPCKYKGLGHCIQCNIFALSC